MIRYFLLLLFLIGAHLYSSSFDNQFNQTSHNEIRSFCVMGERCSGTKFLSLLIEKNFTHLHYESYGHKHFIPWINPPYLNTKNNSTLDDASARCYYAGSDHCLFIVVVRDPYDWLRSFYNKPYHVDPVLYTSFRSFITHQWHTTDTAVPTDNYNPWTNAPFNNVMELRKYKSLNYLTVRNFVKNYLFIRYEDLRDDQSGFLDFLTSTYQIHLKEAPTLIDRYVNHNSTAKKRFKPTEYFIPRLQDINHINREIDWNLEYDMGFKKKEFHDFLKSP